MVPIQPLVAAGRRTDFPAKLQQLKGLCWQLVLIALSVWLVLNAVGTVGRIADYYTPMPMWDYWRVVQHLEAYKHLHLAVFWKQHNEHRIVFPEIAFALDMVFLHGRMILPLVLSFLCYGATWIVLSSTVLADRTLDLKVRFAAVLLAGVVSLWQSAANVLAIPFLLQWTLMQLAVALTFFFLSRFRSTGSAALLWSTIAAAVVGTYSSGNALLLWPLVLCVAFVIRIPRRQLAVLTAAAVATLGLYFVGYHFTGDLKLGNFIHYPLYSLEYIGAYLSMPFGAMRTPMFAVRLGLSACATVGILFAIVLGTRRSLSPPSVVLFSYWGFTFLTALLTAGGRMDPTDQKFVAAQAFRYLTVPQMNWAVVILLLFWTLAALPLLRPYMPGLVIVSALLVLISFPQLMPWLDGLANFFTEQQLAALTVEDGLEDSYWIKTKIFPDLRFYRDEVTELTTNRASIYHRGLNRLIGHSMAEIGQVQSVPLSGVIVQVLPVETGYQVNGWVDITKWRRPYKWLVLVDEKGTILGFGRRFAPGLPTAVATASVPPGLAWVGFISSRLRPEKIFAYVEAPRGKALYPLSRPKEIVPSEIGPTKVNGPPIEDFVWQDALGSTPRSLPEKVDFGERPDTPIISTWNGSDANVETVRSTPFRTPSNSCISIPVLHGPSVDGLALKINDGDRRTQITELPLQAADQKWQYWRVWTGASHPRLEIEVEDNGKSWGQWIAIAKPQMCP
ncbi:MAG: hypothetical protein ACJ74Y_06870 [Bryobacteraceae bacterium]